MDHSDEPIDSVGDSDNPFEDRAPFALERTRRSHFSSDSHRLYGSSRGRSVLGGAMFGWEVGRSECLVALRRLGDGSAGR